MPQAGDFYEVHLPLAAVAWGDEARMTDSRPRRQGEGYIPIPRAFATEHNIVNSNGVNGGADVLGQNLYECESEDGLLRGVIKAAGCPDEGDKYAKQFQGNNDLRLLGGWYQQIGAKAGDTVRVTFVSTTKVLLKYIPS